MTTDLEQRYRRMAERGKYQGLYRHLCDMKTQEWRTTFAEVESIIGFELPPSARDHRAWWANQSPALGHSYAAAWRAAGWETAEVDMSAETLVFRRKLPELPAQFDIDEVLPVLDIEWPEGLSLRREDLYEDRI